MPSNGPKRTRRGRLLPRQTPENVRPSPDPHRRTDHADRVEGWRILTDPTFDACPGRTYKFGWGTSSRKTTGPAIAAADIGPIDAVLLTHEHHADNLDDSGRSGVAARGDRVLTTQPARRRLGPNSRGHDDWSDHDS